MPSARSEEKSEPPSSAEAVAEGEGSGDSTSTALVVSNEFGITGTPEEIAAANKLIGMVRVRQAKKRIRDMIRGLVAKYYDDNSGLYYYYNEKTGETSWDKPALMGTEDILAEGEGDEAKSEDLAPPGTRPRVGEVECIPNCRAEQLAAATALWRQDVKLVQIRVYNMERPFRSMIEVDNGPVEHDCSLRIIVFDRPTPGMTKFQVKLAHKPARCGMLTEYARTRPVAEFLSYDDWAEFWASYAPLPGMKMYYVRYTHSPYRSLVTTEERVGAIWRPHFAFFAYEGVKLTCRASPDGERYAIALPGLMEDWSECFEFVVFTQELPGTSKINVLERHDPELRFKICPGKVASRAGWKLQFSFYALDVPVPGTVKFSVQQRREPDSCRVWKHMPMAPWLHNLYFYAFDP